MGHVNNHHCAHLEKIAAEPRPFIPYQLTKQNLFSWDRAGSVQIWNFCVGHAVPVPFNLLTQSRDFLGQDTWDVD
jgi:hypothetical protein